MGAFWQDLHYGLHMLRKNPGFTFVAVLTLALGIGANTAIFSVVNTVLLRPLPFPHAEQLVSVQEVRTRGPRVLSTASYPNFFDWRARNHVFTHIACFHGASFTSGGAGEPRQLSGAVVSADFFRVLGVAPILGRDFLLEDEKPGHSVVILSNDLWRSAYGADPKIIGRSVVLNLKNRIVVGVMPAGLHFPMEAETVELWSTISGDATPPPEGGDPTTAERGAHFLDVIARLRPGVSPAQANAEMNSIAAALAKQYPDTNTYRETVAIEPELHHVVGRVEPALFVLLAAVGCVLLIACANVANLLLARSITRQREMAIRAALGAGRGRVIRQLLAESVLLSLAGGVAGLLLAGWGTTMLMRLVPADVPRIAQVQVDSAVLLFTLGLSVMTGILFGLAPAWQASKGNVIESLKETGLTLSRGVRHGRLRSALVVAEMGLALVLLMSATLMLRSFARLLAVHPGFNPKKVLTFSVYPLGLDTSEQQVRFYDELLARLKNLPGAESVGGAYPVPLTGDRFGISFSIEGQPTTESNRPTAEMHIVSAGYFHTMGIPVVQGREFTEQDRRSAPFVALVSESFARRYFPNENPIGKRIAPGATDVNMKEDPLREIVGVVGDVRSEALDRAPEPTYYLPYTQCMISTLSIVVRTPVAPEGMIAGARAAVHNFDGALPVYNVKTMEQYTGTAVAQPRFTTLLLVLFAVLALTLTGLGLYGVISYAVAQRTHEIGIRVALGAQSRDVLRLVIRQGLLLTALGGASGLLAGLGLTRFLQSQLYGVRASDPLTFLGVALILLGVALVACYIPARRAIRVDPIVALRYE